MGEGHDVQGRVQGRNPKQVLLLRDGLPELLVNENKKDNEKRKYFPALLVTMGEAALLEDNLVVVQEFVALDLNHKLGASDPRDHDLWGARAFGIFL